MKNFRSYGEGPYRTAVVHGGPGAPGDMAEVAEELSKDIGVIEPLLSAISIDGQIEELRQILKEYGNLSSTMIGHSWGAWLSLIFTAQHPKYVKKLILLGSGPFENRYVPQIMKSRLSRLDGYEKQTFFETIENLGSEKDSMMDDLKVLTLETDYYEPIEHNDDVIKFQPEVYRNVWDEAEELRDNGELLEYVERIRCPVTAIHGAQDPHPYQGVKEPLNKRIDDFRFILIDQCGHYPWYEKHARDEFFKILRNEVKG